MPIEPDPELGLYAISVASQLTGVTPQTLRLYESKGLLEPARTEGGTRRYSRRDLDRVEEIMSMTAEGLTLGGIKRLLEMQAETAALRAEVAHLQGRLDRRTDPPQKPRPAGSPR
jgi:MerR family transcriptional regulator/heat shock protein HspR